MSLKSKIELEIELGEDKVPKKIAWSASDGPVDGSQESSAFLLSLWDGKSKEDRSIHLWTSDMTVEEMNHFYFRMFMLMSDTFQRATQNKEEADAMRAYAREFGHRNGVLKKKV